MKRADYRAIEIEKVPYMGITECKTCDKRETKIIENSIKADWEILAYSTTLQCEKLPICLEIKKRLLEKMRGYVIYGDNKITPIGIDKQERK